MTTIPVDRERMLKMLAVVTFLIFFQAYMVAPIIPALAQTFAVSVQAVLIPNPMRAFNICAGPATLPDGVLDQAADELPDSLAHPHQSVARRQPGFTVQADVWTL
jgi:hypothetical protein